MAERGAGSSCSSFSEQFPSPTRFWKRVDELRAASVVIQDAVDLLTSVQASVTGFNHERATWAETIPERALMSLARFPQSESCTESDGKKTRNLLHTRLMYAWRDDLDALWDEIIANGLPTDDLNAPFIRVKLLLLWFNAPNSRMGGKEQFEQFNQSLWELRQMLGVTALQAEKVAGDNEENHAAATQLKAPATGGKDRRNAKVNPNVSKTEAKHHTRVMRIVEEWIKHHERREGYFLAPLSASKMEKAAGISRRTMMRTVKEMFGIASGKENGGWVQYRLKCQKRGEFLEWLDRIINPSASLGLLSPTQNTAGKRCNSCKESAPELEEYGEQELCAECFAVAVGKT